jgi:hypothetical protein
MGEKDRMLLLPSSIDGPGVGWRVRLRRLAGNGLVRGATGWLWAWALLIATRSPEALQLALAAALGAAGALYLARALVNWTLSESSCGVGLRRLDVVVGLAWIAAAGDLAAASRLIQTPAVVPLLGAATALALYGYALLAGATDAGRATPACPGGSTLVAMLPIVTEFTAAGPRAPRQRLLHLLLRMVGQKRPLGQISAYLDHLLQATTLIAAAFLGLAAAEGLVALVGEGTVAALLAG